MGTDPVRPRIWLYTRHGCLASAEARHWLIRYNVPFTERCIPVNPLLPGVQQETAPIGTPLLVVGDRAIFGFRPGEFERALLEA